MRSLSIKKYVCLNIIIASLVVSGCGPKPYNKQYYVLNVGHEAETAKADNKIVLDVRRFTIDSAFESKGMVYRKGEFEYEVDFYNEFLIAPAIMITEKARTWLSQSGLFERVLDKGSYTEPTHTLEGNITALYGDFRESSSPLAVMEMRVFLIEHKARKESVILGKTYGASVNLKSQDAEGLIEAFNGCLGQILTELEKNLIEKL